MEKTGIIVNAFQTEKIMTFDEADKIFKVWSQWFWPFHFLLNSIFIGGIPESYLPYSQDILEEALIIVEKHYYKTGEKEISNKIQLTRSYLVSYKNDDEAFKQAAEILGDPEMRKVLLVYISKFKKDWMDWLNKQDMF